MHPPTFEANSFDTLAERKRTTHFRCPTLKPRREIDEAYHPRAHQQIP